MIDEKEDEIREDEGRNTPDVPEEQPNEEPEKTQDLPKSDPLPLPPPGTPDDPWQDIGGEGG